MSIKDLTFHEIIAQIEADAGYRQYPYYVLDILTTDGEALTDFPSEGEFMKRMAVGREGNFDELEGAAKLVSQSIASSIHLLEFFVPNELRKELYRKGPTVFRALHEEMFKKLYHIGIGTRLLFEAAIDFEKHDGVEEYIEYLRERYCLTDLQCHSLKMEWADGDDSLCHALLEGDIHLKVFLSEDICFQVCNSNIDYLLKAPTAISTSNGLVISEYYFLSRILTILSHLDLMAKVMAKENGKVYQEAELEIREIFELDSLIAQGNALLSRFD